MVWMRQNKELNIKCRAKNDIFPNSRNMNKGSLCHHSCTLILNVHHFHVGVSCPDHHILPRIADAYNLIHRPNTLCRMRDSHITHNLPRVDATSLDLNIALACIRWHLTGTPLLSRSSWTFLKKSEHDWQEQTLTENVPKNMSQVKLMVTIASLRADLLSFSDWETGSADMDKLLLQSSSCRDLDDWHDHHCNNGQQSFVEFEDMADKH